MTFPPDPEALEDVELLSRVRRADEAALAALYRRYATACYRLAYRILDDEQLAQDVVQQVFLALWQDRSYDPLRGSLGTWLLSIAHHKSVDLLRRERGRRARLGNDQELVELAVSDAAVVDQAWESLRAARTRAALRQLSPEHREVLLLAYYGGYTQREIAEMTGLPIGTVKSRTVHAMRRLRELLASEMLDTGEGDSADVPTKPEHGEGGDR